MARKFDPDLAALFVQNYGEAQPYGIERVGLAPEGLLEVPPCD